MKHQRRIALTEWQQEIVNDHPWRLIAGLLHSDGSRVANNVTVRGKRYSYPRWFFGNESHDIMQILGRTLTSVGVEWRVNRPNSLSIAKRASVALVDEHVGLKT